MRFIQHLLLVITWFGAWAVNAAFPSGRDEDGIERLVKRLLKDWHTPGMSIAIVNGDKTWAKASHFHTFRAARLKAYLLEIQSYTSMFKLFSRATVSRFSQIHPSLQTPYSTWEALPNRIPQQHYLFL